MTLLPLYYVTMCNNQECLTPVVVIVCCPAIATILNFLHCYKLSILTDKEFYTDYMKLS